MEAHDDGAGTALRAIAVVAIALAGLAFAVVPVLSDICERADATILDAQWRLLRRFDSRPSPGEIVIVGVDEATVKSIPEPPGLWHASLGRALAKLASVQPRAMALALPLPERSMDGVKPGLDRALFDGLAAAVEAGPFVAVLSIDARTRGARNIHLPYLALLGESRLGIDLTARDADGVARRFSLLVPTEDGGFPTLEGRLCRAMKRPCNDGLIHYALGSPYTYVPMKNLLAMTDVTLLQRLFHDRIVLIGEAQAFSDRVEVPLNLAAWEPQDARHSPGVVVHAQTLRTALAEAAPREASRPLGLVLMMLAAAVFLVRPWPYALLAGCVAALAFFAGAIVALRGGVFLPAGAILFTLLLATSLRALAGLGSGKKP
jgi:CHASE2 domain-containing sensor protein